MTRPNETVPAPRLAAVGVIRGVGTAITAADDAFLAMVGWTRAEFDQGLMDWAAMTPPEFLPLDQAGIKQATETGGFTVPYQKEFFRRDGSRIAVLLMCAFVPGAEGAWVGYVVDLSTTEARQADARDAVLPLTESALPQFFYERLIAELVRERGRMVRMLDSAEALIWAVDPELRLLSANAAFQASVRASFGRPMGIGDTVTSQPVSPERAQPWEQAYRRALAGERQTLQTAGTFPDGPHQFESQLSPMHAPDGELLGVTVVSRDVTAERALEERLRQAHKMEAVGQLAGGIAHDFNNLLTVIGSSLEFMRETVEPAHQARPDLEEIAAATERARTLVRQLLTFSRKQQVHPQVVSVGDVVRRMERLLRRVIGEEIALEVLIDQGKPPVLIDPGQLEQVVMNLVVNARDALLTPRHGHAGRGGMLAIEVSRRELREEDLADGETLSPGPHVELVVRDSGHGMDEATRRHIFEPFFTTKAVGAGTGLGLATVHGIVQQARGAIRVESTPGAGSTFTVLLPAAIGAPVSTSVVAPSAGLDGPTGTVLLAEDEAPVRAIVRRVLERRGYTVLETRHGADALLLWQRHPGRIDAVVTDVRMPELGGRELVAQLRRERPELPVVYLSGYADAVPGGCPGPRDRFVEKPFAADTLLAALAELLRT